VGFARSLGDPSTASCKAHGACSSVPSTWPAAGFKEEAAALRAELGAQESACGNRQLALNRWHWVPAVQGCGSRAALPAIWPHRRAAEELEQS